MHGTVTSGRHVPYPPVSIDQLRAMLEDHRRFRLEQLADLAGTPQAALPPSQPSGGTHSTNSTDRPPADCARSEVSAALAAAARQALEDIEVALTRMDAGRYGRCLDCDAAIPVEQLLAVPQAGSCVACQRTAG